MKDTKYQKYLDWFVSVWGELPDTTYMGIDTIKELIQMRREPNLVEYNGKRTPFIKDLKFKKKLRILTYDEYLNGYRIPRKLKKKIPKGVYCYTLLEFNKETLSSSIKLCPFFTHIKLKEKPLHTQDEIDAEYPEEYTGWCKLIQYEIEDRCKSCSIKRHSK